ncbi:MAG: ABC transporter ATP-binding protein [Planctomycetota bacterium]|nr:MAG: ABC transporter ATP-binding protein [Planctomycetota bacterium]
MPTNEPTVVQTIGLTKIFKDFWHRDRVVAVDKLDLNIHRNQVFGLLGPNGSGKTTTIKMLLGLLYPTRGRINVLGRAPTDVAIKSRIGYLPEESYLYRFLDARETLDYYARLFQIPRQDRRRRVEQLLEMVGLTREARRRVGEYSKGMARRIGLAQALINDPDLLILDEPTTGLDPVGTKEIKDLINFLNRQKQKTILLCSHLLADVEDVCQQVTVLYGGRQQAVGNIRELLSQKNLTQITTERLSDAAIDRICKLVAEEESKRVVSVSTPSDKLETFFLRIVKRAQEARQQTSGVTAGGRIAEFLATDASQQRPEAVVDSLIAAAESVKTTTEEPESTIPPEEPAKDVIDELLTTTQTTDSDESADMDQAASEAVTDQPDQGDREFIDRLIKGSDKENDDDKE